MERGNACYKNALLFVSAFSDERTISIGIVSCYFSDYISKLCYYVATFKTMSSPSSVYVVRHAKENCDEQMAARPPRATDKSFHGRMISWCKF